MKVEILSSKEIKGYTFFSVLAISIKSLVSYSTLFSSLFVLYFSDILVRTLSKQSLRFVLTYFILFSFTQESV